MKRKNVVRALIAIGILALAIVLVHLIGGNIAAMIKGHMGM
ncbi:MAG TPA: hypothetical protein VHT96_06335 [Clostridia bacterium]|nr:hypothetical protein [Clostridia bacterium]